MVVELKGQMAELNEQLSQRSKSLENELAKREQQVYYNAVVTISMSSSASCSCIDHSLSMVTKGS